MFSTSVAMVALCSLLGTSNAQQPTWHTDYRAAAAMAAELHKPLAVFITKGSGVVTRDLPTEVNRVLSTDYVSLVINSEDDRGKLLSERFEMEQGVVISDRTGVKQALRIEGSINPGDFAHTLSRLADPNRIMARTEVQSPTSTVLTTGIVPAVYSEPTTPVAVSSTNYPTAPTFTPAPVATYVPPAAPSFSRSIVPTYYAPAPTTVCRTGT
jgi:hypothetical protein